MSTNWDGANRAVQPDVAFGKGYDVKTTDMQANESGSNAYLIDSADKSHIKLTVVGIESSLKLSGKDGQSQMQRDFYARNFEQTTWTITVQARSQKDVGRCAEFVHKAQRNAVSRGSLMNLLIPSGGLNHVRAPADGSRDGMKGTRRAINMDGYVKTMPRAHKRHDPAPKYSFDFTVARMHSGIFEDQPYKVYKLAKWSEIVDTILAGNFIKPPKSQAQEQQEESLREVIESIPFIGDALGDIFG
jgi:hypothetical protein